MKKTIQKTVLCSLLISSAWAIVVGDQIELEAYLNARTSAKFQSNSGNVKTQLSSGTKGVVAETKKMPSGNYGIKMKVENGPHNGETYWVYLDLKHPKIKLFNDKSQNVKVEQIAQAKKAVITEKVEAIRAPEEAAVESAVKTAGLVLNNNKAAQIINPVTGADCVPETSVVSTNVSEDQYSESDVVEPYREKSDQPLHSSTCRGTEGGWDQCRNSDTKMIEAFKLSNKGPNKIVKTNEYYISRDMSFEFENHARSEMKFVVSDSPDDTTSHATYSIMLFFPRTVLPAIKKVGDELIVTLPNKEIVKYNASTKEIIGGVFTEGPMASNPNNKKAVPANIKYTGAGVMIRADKSGDLPYGDIELSNGNKAPSTSTATISKKGFKDCKVPAKDIWYTDYNKGANAFIKNELATDKGLDDFIKQKCGFSLY